MPTGIDHIVIAVRDLDRAIADYTAAGFTVAPGGEHTHGTTHNALIPFQDGSYFELIAWKDPDAPLAADWWRRFHAGEGLIDFALRTDDLDDEVARLRSTGLNVSNPEHGGRLRPDGQRVEWRTLRFADGTAPSLPFYCHSTNDRALRVPGGDAAIHENRITGVGGMTIGVTDLRAATRDYARMLGAPDEAGRFAVGNDNFPWITLVHHTADDPARDNLPIEIILSTNHGAVGQIDPILAHGARLTIESPASAGSRPTVL